MNSLLIITSFSFLFDDDDKRGKATNVLLNNKSCVLRSCVYSYKEYPLYIGRSLPTNFMVARIAIYARCSTEHTFQTFICVIEMFHILSSTGAVSSF